MHRERIKKSGCTINPHTIEKLNQNLEERSLSV
jgi:hypothetical protein